MCVLSVMSILPLLYYFQMSGYSIKSLYIDFASSIQDRYFFYFDYLLIFILLSILNFTNVYFLIFLVWTLVLISCKMLQNQLKFISEIKYTKRMIRLLIVAFALSATLISVEVAMLNNLFLSLIIPSYVFVAYLVVFVGYLIMYPIEKMIGAYYINKSKNKLKKMQLIKIGITGSCGKTSVKEILYSVVSCKYNSLATPKSYNTPFGISKTINNQLDDSHEVLICEMGAKKKGEIKYLCNMTKINYGIITAVARQHTNTFGNIDNIYHTKKELADYLSNGGCVFNLNNKYVKKMYDEYNGEKIGVFVCLHSTMQTRQILKKIFYALHKSNKDYKIKRLYCFSKKSNIYAKNCRLGENGSTFDIYFEKQLLCSAAISLLCVHNITNVVLAVAMAKMIGLSDKEIKVGLANIKPINARLEKIVLPNGAVIINNGYNSNIDSAKHSLEVLGLFDRKYKVVVTPGLIETSDDYESNKAFGKLIAAKCNKIIIVKETNKTAIYAGVCEAKFDVRNLSFANSFDKVNEIFAAANKDYVFLIENDLPNNYK